MVNVVVLSSSPEGQEVVQAPGELVAAVGVDGLEQTDDNPGVHGQNVKVLCDGAEDNGNSDSAKAQNHDFDGRRVFSRETKGGGVLVVDLVDVLVEEGACVHGAVSPVVPRVFQDEEDCDLIGHLVQAREGDGGREAKVLAHGVEQPNLGKFDGEVGEEDEEGALCLFPSSGDFVLGRVSVCCRQLLVQMSIPAGACSG